MFNETTKALQSLEAGSKLSLDVEPDDDGYFDRECKKCNFNFKVYLDDWKNLFKDEAVFCPMCAHEAVATEWNTEEQTNVIIRNAENYLSNLLGNAFTKDARNFNSRQGRNSFINISMSTSGFQKEYVKIPLIASEAMELKIKCQKCTASFAVIGSAFFCPCCGYNCVENIVDSSLSKIQESVTNIENIKSSLGSTLSKDDVANISRSIVENGITEAVAAFQAYCEAVYVKITGNTSKKNLFQRIQDGSGAWIEIFGFGYNDWLKSDEFEKLTLYFQRRHILAHKNGIVDEEYIEKSGDTNYKAGQRIVIKPENVLEFIPIVRTLVTSIRSAENKYKK